MSKPIIALEALQALDAIAKQGSFAAAAAALYKVPSALTYTIKKLEDDLGVALFDRSKQRAELTAIGQLVLEQGRELLLASERLVAAVQQADSGWEKQLRIALDTVLSHSPLFDLIAEFSQLGPRVDISISTEALGGGWDALHSERADIAIGVTGELPKGWYETMAIGELQFVFAVAADHPLASVNGPLTNVELAQYPAIVVADTSQLLPSRNSGLFQAKHSIRVNHVEAKIAAQVLGLGIGFIPRHLAQPYLSQGLLVAKTVAMPRPAQTMYIAWRKNRGGNAMQWFLQRLCQTGTGQLDWGLTL